MEKNHTVLIGVLLIIILLLIVMHPNDGNIINYNISLHFTNSPNTNTINKSKTFNIAAVEGERIALGDNNLLPAKSVESCPSIT